MTPFQAMLARNLVGFLRDTTDSFSRHLGRVETWMGEAPLAADSVPEKVLAVAAKTEAPAEAAETPETAPETPTKPAPKTRAKATPKAKAVAKTEAPAEDEPELDPSPERIREVALQLNALDGGKEALEKIVHGYGVQKLVRVPQSEYTNLLVHMKAEIKRIENEQGN
nr:MAG TPA: hypothetical protein [Caudoviricetes sp.]